MPIPHILLIDGNNLGYASMYAQAYSGQSADGPIPLGVTGLIRSLLRILRLFPGAVPVVLWDGHAGWRKTLCPEYKGNRNTTPEAQAITDSWNRQQPVAREVLVRMGILQIRSPNAEADDLAGLFCRDPGRLDAYGIQRITLVTGDTDWWQALSERVDWFTPITDRTMTLETLRTPEAKGGPFTGPEEYILAKAIAGDPSDNIAGVPGVGLLTAVKLLRRHGGLEGLVQAVTAGVARDQKSLQIAEALPRIARNRRLMDWRLAPVAPEPVEITCRPFDPSACFAFCAELGIARFAERILAEWEPARSTAEVLRYCQETANSALSCRSVA